MAKEMEKPKPPKKPRCFYKKWWMYLLGISSPSKHFMLSFNPTPEATEYFEAYAKYTEKLMLWKIENRICTREEWAVWYSKNRRDLRAAQNFENGLTSLKEAAHKLALSIEIGIKKLLEETT